MPTRKAGVSASPLAIAVLLVAEQPSESDGAAAQDC